ncbi:MAG TPA: cysteine--tRNA ligase, partial [Thalassospira sp.]|nr:cysteine--tRNA ligase [Thalassospira sp.]
MTKTLRIFDTLTREKQVFKPIDPDHVRLYVCGPTVYDYAHVGNARPVVVFDTLVRVLRHIYPKVTYVRNVTDVDDKINARAKESGEPISEITKRTHQAYLEDMGALNAAKPDIEPRATEHIAEMIAMCESLIEQGFAYAAEGHVLFSVEAFDDYGKLSRRDRKEMIAGARVEVAPYKKDPADFVLWKPSSDDIPGWDSPWGRGRPGWHIECSAMSTRYLGENFDIHGGGSDLVFPHHENELAQSCCANKGSSYAKYWMHNGHLMVEGEKMS